MSIDWNWGIFLQQAPFGNTTYLGWLWSGFQITVALSISALDHRLFSSAHCSAFYARYPIASSRALAPAMSNCFATMPLIVQFFTLVPGGAGVPCRKNIGMWFKSELDPNIQFFVSSMLCLGLFTAARVCGAGTRRHPVAAARAEERRPGDGPDPAANLPLRAAAERLPRYRAADDLGDDELVKNSAIASTIGLADMAAQAGKLLDYSAHAWESFTAITLAYVFINAVIMLIMYVVERKVRLPGNMGGK